jgi:formylglycine-generating enzyme required for sulfatase activity
MVEEMWRPRYRNHAAFAGITLALCAIALGCSRPDDRPLVALAVETKVHTLDGCADCGCRSKGEIEPGAQREWWTSFGLASPDPQEGWKAIGASSHCGSGPYEKVAADFSRTLGTPYIVLDLSTISSVIAPGDIRLETKLKIQKLTGFDEDGQPVYARSVRQRDFALVGEPDIALPLLIADKRETAAFGVHEVLVELQTQIVEHEPGVAYGFVSVTSDVPGAEILLDGGFVGRIAEDNPILLKNVLAGTRDIRVRDFSGREAQRDVIVKDGETAEVALEVLNLSTEPPDELVSIGKNPQGHHEYWRERDRAMMVRIPAGEFPMGSPDGEGEPDERPQHRVYVSEFLIDKTEVTWRQFRKFAEATGARLPPEPTSGSPDDYSVSFILWEEAKTYCEWTGGRLPTEAEWEKAARGTDGRKYAWGDEWDPRRCNSISGGMHQPESAGAYPECLTPYGVLDMPGGMWEWCSDRYGENYYAESESRDPKGPATGRLHIMRGGAWMSQPMWLRTAYRVKRSPTSRNADHGFRCARDAPE